MKKKGLSVVIVILLLAIAGSILYAVPAYNDRQAVKQAVTRQQVANQASALNNEQGKVIVLESRNNTLASKQASLCAFIKASKLTVTNTDLCN